MDTARTTSSRIGRSFVAGCCSGIPAGIILSYLAVLPLYLGLFFFLVLGLLIGAIMFRFGRGGAPARPGPLRLVGAAVVLITWTTTLVTEYAAFPGLAAGRVIMSWYPRPLKPDKEAEIDRRTRHHVMSQLLGREYRGGTADRLLGFPAYLKWVATDGVMTCPRVLDDSQFRLVMRQRRGSWIFRLILSMGLLAFSIFSQYLLLARPSKAPATGDDNPSHGPT